MHLVRMQARAKLFFSLQGKPHVIPQLSMLMHSSSSLQDYPCTAASWPLGHTVASHQPLVSPELTPSGKSCPKPCLWISTEYRLQNMASHSERPPPQQQLSAWQPSDHFSLLLQECQQKFYPCFKQKS